MPLSTPVEVFNVTPPGNAPETVNDEAGKPVVVTVKFPAMPSRNVAVTALVIAGACVIASVNDCVAFGPDVLLAVNTRL